jgi:tetratricopeptide (TPR) repeat protein
MSLTLLLWVSQTCLSKSVDSLSVGTKLEQIENQVSEVRRDELNYRIEKDLLNETFSSNLKTINIVITVVLGVFAVLGFLLGFLGIRSIETLRKQYFAELERINGIRKELEIKTTEITREQEKISKEQEKARNDYLEMIKNNEVQNKKIQVLELQEKVSQLQSAGNHQRALEYATIGLEIEPKNVTLLHGKAVSLWKVNDLLGAAEAFHGVLEIEPTQLRAILSLMELDLILNRIEEYDSLYLKNKTAIDSRGSGYPQKYLNTFALYRKNDEEALTKFANEILSAEPPDEKRQRTRWDFSDVISFLQSQPDGKEKKILILIISFLSGNISASEAKKRLKT